ncbi:MAG: hypothetical protein JXR91_04715 [Deltaproteobacteria bacterium]|nr:hypothetical protein [Deltaproteobacteria bacterium]
MKKIIQLLLLLLLAGCSRVSPISDETDSKSTDTTNINSNSTDSSKLSDSDSQTDSQTDSQSIPNDVCNTGDQTCINNSIYECINNKYELYKDCTPDSDVCPHDYKVCTMQTDNRATCENDDVVYSLCDTGTFADCYDCVTGDYCLCGKDYQNCMNDTECATLDSCISGPDASSCFSQNLTGDAWDACETACKNAATDAANALRYSLIDCLFCIGCGTTKPEGTHCSTENCDLTSSDCYDPATGCWGCAINTICRTQVDACNANPECGALDSCINTSCYNSTDSEILSDSDFETCRINCEAKYPNGVADLAAYHACIYCDACPTTCAEDAEDRCQE